MYVSIRKPQNTNKQALNCHFPCGCFRHGRFPYRDHTYLAPRLSFRSKCKVKHFINILPQINFLKGSGFKTKALLISLYCLN